MDLDPRETDLEYFSVTRRETRDAIYTAAQLNAPGISGLMGRAWRWAWSVLQDENFSPNKTLHRLRLPPVRTCPRPGVYTTSGYLQSSDVSTRGHSRGTGPC